MSQEHETNSGDECMSAKTSSSTSNSIEENKENVTVIWFKPVPDKANNIEQIKSQLRTVNDFLLCSSDIDDCMTNVNSIKEKRIFLITTASNACQLLPQIINLPQLHSVFLFPENPEEYARLYDDFYKVVGIFEKTDALISSIRENTKHVNRHMKVISFYNQHQHGTRDLSGQSPDFLWFQQFKDVIDHLPHDDGAKEEMLSACQQYYRDNRRILNDIENFRETYHPDNCIEWYTKNTFVYELINKALRTEDIEQLYIFRYYIADLSQQLAKQCRMMKNNGKNKMTLYRGTVISQKELDILKAHVGHLFAANSYWSTSLCCSIALTFAKKSPPRSGFVAVLCEIECDLEDEDDSVIGTDISDLSEFRIEKEVLFDAGSIFRINGITKRREDDMDVHIIKISTSKQGHELARKYIDLNRVKMKEEGPRLMLSALLKRMGKSQKCLELLQYLLKNPDGKKLAYIHNRIGKVLLEENQHEEALKHFQEAFQLAKNSDPPNKTLEARVRYNEGLVYSKRRNYRKALYYYQLAVTILKDERGNHNPLMAKFYNGIGRVHRYQGDLDQALKYQHLALKMRERVRPDHFKNASSYTAVGDVYFDKKNYKKALEHYLKALELRRRQLPSTSFYIAWSLNDVGRVYYAMNDSQRARGYYLEHLEIYKLYENTNLRRDIPNIHQAIAKTYSYGSQEALDHRLRALEIIVHPETVNRSILSTLLDDIVWGYKAMNRKDDLLGFYKRDLKIREEFLYHDKFNLARLLDDIAYLYDQMGRTRDSLQFYRKGLQIRQENLSDNNFNLSHSFSHLACAHEKLNEIPSAQYYYHELLKIYQHCHHPLCAKTTRNIQRIESRLR